LFGGKGVRKATSIEDVSFRLYEKMAAIFSGAELKDVFSKLAEEEAEHKRRFEVQYEQMS